MFDGAIAGAITAAAAYFDAGFPDLGEDLQAVCKVVLAGISAIVRVIFSEPRTGWLAAEC